MLHLKIYICIQLEGCATLTPPTGNRGGTTPPNHEVRRNLEEENDYETEEEQPPPYHEVRRKLEEENDDERMKNHTRKNEYFLPQPGFWTVLKDAMVCEKVNDGQAMLTQFIQNQKYFVIENGKA